jgi:hypothetical protein
VVVDIVADRAVERQAIAGEVPREEALAVLFLLALHLDCERARLGLARLAPADGLPRDLTPGLSCLRLEGRHTPDVSPLPFSLANRAVPSLRHGVLDRSGGVSGARDSAWIEHGSACITVRVETIDLLIFLAERWPSGRRQRS